MILNVEYIIVQLELKAEHYIIGLHTTPPPPYHTNFYNKKTYCKRKDELLKKDNTESIYEWMNPFDETIFYLVHILHLEK